MKLFYSIILTIISFHDFSYCSYYYEHFSIILKIIVQPHTSHKHYLPKSFSTTTITLGLKYLTMELPNSWNDTTRHGGDCQHFSIERVILT